MSAIIIYRGPGPWGGGKGSNLTANEFDTNNWNLSQAIDAKAAQGVGIQTITVDSATKQMTIQLTDNTYQGPFTLPVAEVEFRGTWQPNTAYAANDIFTQGGSTYVVLVNHTSAATFDPNANDGAGHNYYEILLQNPAVIPPGGVVGMFLRKATTADYATAWETAALEDLNDVVITPPAEAEVLTYQSGTWRNAVPPAQALGGLTDVTISAPADKQALTYVASAGKWQNTVPQIALATLTDVALTTPAAGQPLIYNGTSWTDASTVDMPCGGLMSASGSLTINRATGEVQRFSLTGTVTSISIVGWPSGGQFARLVLEIQNTGGFGWAWPSNVLWPSGSVPAVTANGKDVFILISFDGGTTIYGNVVGQAFA